jgi:uncharacterized membrane protein YdbT with pleckstrin-like domain
MFGFEHNEKVLMLVRRHWFLFAVDILFLGVLASAPLLFAVFIPDAVLQSLAIAGNRAELGFFLYALWLLILWVALFIRWTDYYLDLWVITDKRIVDVEQRGLFSREVVTASLDRIQNVVIDTNGLIPTLMNFGDVRIETAGAETRNIIIKSAANPEEVKSLILKALDASHSESRSGL